MWLRVACVLSILWNASCNPCDHACSLMGLVTSLPSFMKYVFIMAAKKGLVKRGCWSIRVLWTSGIVGKTHAWPPLYPRHWSPLSLLGMRLVLAPGVLSVYVWISWKHCCCCYDVDERRTWDRQTRRMDVLLLRRHEDVCSKGNLRMASTMSTWI